MSVSINGTGGITFADASTQNTGGYTGFRNRIINGAMMIDQRNAGAASTSLSTYALDRWNVGFANTGVNASFQKVADAPIGFVNSFKVTVTTAPGSVANSASINQPIEGLNTSDLAWGTSSAQTVTLSFWVKASLTGSFGGALTNSAFDQTYPFPYTISAANTWEYKTVVIVGPTSGTWLTTNATGINVIFGLGAASERKAAAGVWANTIARQPTGSINLVETNGATFYITGVQLEKGSVATPFEFRPYGTELALCQRYFQTISNGPGGACLGSTNYYFGTLFPVVMRATPSAAVTAAIRISDITTSSYTQSSGNIAVNLVTPEGGSFNLGNFTGLPNGRFAILAQLSSGTIQLSAEL